MHFTFRVSRIGPISRRLLPVAIAEKIAAASDQEPAGILGATGAAEGSAEGGAQPAAPKAQGSGPIRMSGRIKQLKCEQVHFLPAFI